eukprot:COSAG06_NODE_4335_length_4357_cov_120.961954_7_plen_131_part_00
MPKTPRLPATPQMSDSQKQLQQCVEQADLEGATKLLAAEPPATQQLWCGNVVLCCAICVEKRSWRSFAKTGSGQMHEETLKQAAFCCRVNMENETGFTMLMSVAGLPRNVASEARVGLLQVRKRGLFCAI